MKRGKYFHSSLLISTSLGNAFKKLSFAEVHRRQLEDHLSSAHPGHHRLPAFAQGVLFFNDIEALLLLLFVFLFLIPDLKGLSTKKSSVKVPCAPRVGNPKLEVFRVMAHYNRNQLYHTS